MRKERIVFTLLLAVLLQLCICGTDVVHAAEIAVTVEQCVISEKNVTVTATSMAVPVSADGTYYLFELKPYELGVGTRRDYCAKAPASAAASLSLIHI